MLILIVIIWILYEILTRVPEPWPGVLLIALFVGVLLFAGHEERKDYEAWRNRRDYWLHYDKNKHRHKW